MRSSRLLTGLLAVALSWIAGGAAARPKRKPPRSPASAPTLATQATTKRLRVKAEADDSTVPTRQRPVRRGTKGKKAKRPEPDRWPPMKLEAVNGGERATLRLYDRRGRTLKPAVRKIWSMMRCHLTGKQRPIHWRLVRGMYRISRRYPGKTIYIYSGYRARRVASLPNSNHVKGRALDLRVEGVSNRALRDFLLATFRPAGIGFYPNGSFVHFDVREKQSAFWVDYSGKGEASEYASNPYEVLGAEREAARKAKAETKATKKHATRSPAGSAAPASQPLDRDTAADKTGEKARKATTSEEEPEPESAKDTPGAVSNPEEGPTAQAPPRPTDGAAQ
jgi:uncharacterized protein YcbK (DUF882 family)